MIALEKFKKTGFFTEVSLKAGDILFREGEINNKLYIIYAGELCIQKSITSQVGSFKLLDILGKGDIIGEGSLTNSHPKEVQVSASQDTLLLEIDAQTAFQKFFQSYPEEGYNLMLSIIELGNTRLLKSNRQLTAHFEISQAIAQIGFVDFRGINGLLDIFQTLLQADSILYFEKNLALDTYYKLRYYTGVTQNIQNTIIQVKYEEKLGDILGVENISLKQYVREIPLILGSQLYGFLVISRDTKDFGENEERLLHTIATSFVGVIYQKILQDEQKNKSHVKGYSI